MHIVFTRAAFTLKICAVLLAALLLSAVWPDYMSAVALAPCRNGVWSSAPSLVLHSIAIAGLVHWAPVCASLVCSALVCEEDLGPKGILVLWVISSVLGSAAFLIFADSCTPFIGPAAFAWAYAGAAVAAIALRWKNSRTLAKFYVVLVGIGFLVTLGDGPGSQALQNFALLLGASWFAYLVARRRRQRDSPSAAA